MPNASKSTKHLQYLQSLIARAMEPLAAVEQTAASEFVELAHGVRENVSDAVALLRDILPTPDGFVVRCTDVGLLREELTDTLPAARKFARAAAADSEHEWRNVMILARHKAIGTWMVEVWKSKGHRYAVGDEEEDGDDGDGSDHSNGDGKTS